MNSVIRVPTEPYGYFEIDFEGTPKEMAKLYKELADAWKDVSTDYEYTTITGVEWRRKNGKSEFKNEKGEWENGKP